MDPLIAKLKKYRKLKRWNGLVPMFIFIVLALPIGLYLVFNVPAMFSADGGAHVSRAWQISDGRIRSTYINHAPGVGYGGAIPINLYNLKTLETGIVGTDGTPGLETRNKLLTSSQKQAIAQIADQKISKEKVEVSFVNSAAYSPVAYAPSVIGILIGKLLNFTLGHTLQLAGLCGFLTFLICVCYSLYTLRRNQLKWAILTVALLPLVVYESSVITADALLMSIAILFSALLIKAFNRGSGLTTLDKVLLYICVLAIPQIKSVYFPLVFLILLIPREKWSTKKAYWIFTGTSLVISMIGFAIWSSLTTDIAASNGLVRGLPWQYGYAKIQEKFVLHHPFGYIHAVIDSLIYESNFYINTYFGWLGFTYMPIPGLSLVAGFLALGLSILLAGEQKFSRFVPRALSAANVLITIIIFTTLYITYTLPKLGDVEGVQGRYFLPITILAIAAIAGAFPKLRIAKDGLTTAKIVLVILIGFCFTFSMYRYGLALTT